jgi:ectoine hydroxylase-related dioxygenase (phytanoyl-CoA dioxygenase family)
MKAITNKLPALDTFKEVSEDLINQFTGQGHVLIKGILTAEDVAAYQPVIANAVNKLNTETRELKDRDTYGKAFLQIMNLWRVDEEAKQFVMARRFAKIAADLLGVKNVRIFHDQALFKEPGGGPTPWHQDQYYWPVDTHDTVTMWMPMVDIDIEMGMLTFASGSHANGPVFDFEISDESDSVFDKYVDEHAYPTVTPDVMKAGDATFHKGFTIHKAPGNYSDKMREVMTIIYVADGARVAEPKNQWQQNDLEKWLMGKPVGSLIDSELNPKVL